jgi:hypothetical protein
MSTWRMEEEVEEAEEVEDSDTAGTSGDFLARKEANLGTGIA